MFGWREKLKSEAWFHRMSRRAAGTFFISLGLMILFLLRSPEPTLYSVLFGVVDILVMTVSSLAYVGLVMLRDAILTGVKPWRFSMRTLLMLLTVLAVLLGLLLW